MTKKKTSEFSSRIRKKVLERAGNRCERCRIDFDDDSKGEFHHIIPLIYGGKSVIENCSLLCGKCHNVAPNVKNENDMLIYRYYFLRFSSFKEAAKYYKVDNRLELYHKIAMDIYKDQNKDKNLKKPKTKY